MRMGSGPDSPSMRLSPEELNAAECEGLVCDTIVFASLLLVSVLLHYEVYLLGWVNVYTSIVWASWCNVSTLVAIFTGKKNQFTTIVNSSIFDVN